MNWDMNSDEHIEMDRDEFEKVMVNLKSNNYYFQLDFDPDNVPYFNITPKDYFDTNKCLLDDYIPLNVFPPGFCDLQDSTFEYDGDPQVGRQLLLQAGFIEKKMF